MGEWRLYRRSNPVTHERRLRAVEAFTGPHFAGPPGLRHLILAAFEDHQTQGLASDGPPFTLYDDSHGHEKDSDDAGGGREDDLGLNTSQRKAVVHALESPVCLIQVPPLLHTHTHTHGL